MSNRVSPFSRVRFLLLVFLLIGLSQRTVGGGQIVPTTVETVFCRVLEVLPGTGQTHEVQVDRGLADGLVQGWKGTAYAVFRAKPRRDYTAIGSAETLSTAAQTARVRVTLQKPPASGGIQVGDLVELRARVPQLADRSLLWTLSREHIVFLDNFRTPLNVYRDLYAGETVSRTNAILEKMVEAVRETAEFTTSLDTRPARYQGKPIHEIMEKVTPADILNFLRFVESYPGKYLGNDWKISETFATWLLNEAPTGYIELGEQLMSAHTPAERAAILQKHQKEIRKDSMLANWYDWVQRLTKERKFERAHALAEATCQACDLLKQTEYRGWALFAKAYVSFDQEQYRQAEESGQQAIAAFRALKPQTEDALKGQAFSTHNRGLALQKMGRLKEALHALEAAWKIKIGVASIPESSRAISWQAIGEVQFALGNFGEAVSAFRKAADIARKLDDTDAYAGTMAWLASAYSRLGRTSEATRTYTSILALQIRETNRAGQAETLIRLGDHHWRGGRYPQALQAYTETARIREDLGDRKGVAEALNGIGKLQLNLGKHDDALKAHQRALALCRERDDLFGQARALKEIGDLYRTSGDYPKALAHYQECRTLRKQREDRVGEADVLEQIGMLQNARNAHRESQQSYAEAAELYRLAGAKESLARCLYNRGVAYENLTDYPAALRDYRQALAMRQAIGVKADIALTLSSIADILQKQRESRNALHEYERALILATKTDNRSLMARIYVRMGSLYSEQFAYGKSRTAFEKALLLYRDPKAQDRSQEAWALAATAAACSHQGQFPQAQTRYEQALQIAEALQERPLVFKILIDLGWLHRTLGKPEQALASIQRSRKMAQEIGDAIGIADADYALGALSSDLGDARHAFEYAARALQTYQENNHTFGMQLVENATGVYFYRQGDVVEAKAHFLRALALAEKCEARRDIATALENLGETLFREGDYAGAIGRLRRALQIAQGLGDSYTVATQQVTLARCYREQGEALLTQKRTKTAQEAFAQSERRLHSALTILRQAGAQGAIAGALQELGSLKTAQRQFAAAAAALREAVVIGEATKQKHLLWEAYGAQGKLAEARGDIRGAVEATRKAVAVVEDLRQGVAGGEQGLEKFLHSKIRLYESMAERLGRLGAKERDPAVRKRLAEEALRYVGLARFQVLNQKAVNNAVTGDKALDAMSRQYHDSVLRQGQLEREKTEAVMAGNAGKAGALEVALARNDEELVRNYVQIKNTDQEFAARLKFDPRALMENVTALPPKTCLLLCFPGKDDLHLWVFDSSGFRVWERVPMPRAALYGLVQQFRDGIDQVKGRVVRREAIGEGFGAAAEASEKNPVWYRDNIRGLRQTLSRLYGALIAPVAKELAAGENVLILPYGQLCYLPFEALTHEVSGRGTVFLGQEKRLSYFTSENHLQKAMQALERTTEHGTDCWVGFADPRGRLGSAMEEAQEIAVLFPVSEIHSQKSGNATKSAVFTLRPDCTILHFATHGWLNSGDPNQTFLEMGIPEGGPQTVEVKVDDSTLTLNSDGALTQLEIYPRLRKVASSFKKRQIQLVTLSACETARAQTSPEAEVLGMPDAFTMAGAASVLASQWSVETYSTTDLMIDFYRLYIKEKRSRADALYQAKQTLMTGHSGRYAHPFYWAPFVLFGDWR